MSQESLHDSNTTRPKNASVESTPPSSVEIAKQNGTLQLTPTPTRRNSHNSANKNKFHEIQGSLMIVAVLAAGATYQAGMSPPGGLWQANDDQGHIAGTPVLKDTYPHFYTAFFYCNSTAFIMSLVIIIMLMNIEFYNNPRMIRVLQIMMVLDLFGFMGAYAAGSCRALLSSIYLFLLMGGVFVYVLSFALRYGLVRNIVSRAPCLKRGSTDLV